MFANRSQSWKCLESSLLVAGVDEGDSSEDRAAAVDAADVVVVVDLVEAVVVVASVIT